MTTRIPLFLLGGFLGSGKTTLLRSLLRQPAFSRTAVIVNEFGAVGIDDALITRGQEDNVVLLDSGCICCALTSSLEESLEDLYYRRARGEVPDFERVVIETTGLADPGPIASNLAGGLVTRRYFTLAAIVITVDLVHGHQQLSEHDEARRQVAMADRLVLTKSDLATPAQVAATLAAIEALNAHAPRTLAMQGQVDDDVWRGIDGDLAPVLVNEAVDDAAGSPARLRSACPDCLAGRPHRHGLNLQAAPGLHGHGYVSTVVTIPNSVSWSDYAARVGSLPQLAGSRLLRVKGWLDLDGWRTIQGVGLLFSPPEPAERPPASTDGVLVLIARDSSEQELQSWAAALLIPARTDRSQHQPTCEARDQLSTE